MLLKPTSQDYSPNLLKIIVNDIILKNFNASNEYTLKISIKKEEEEEEVIHIPLESKHL